MGRPTLVTVFAVFNTLYGLLLISFGAAGLFWTAKAMVLRESNPDLAESLVPTALSGGDPLLTTFSLVSLALSAFVGVAAIRSAIGLLMMRHWARLLAIRSGVLLMVLFVITSLQKVLYFASQIFDARQMGDVSALASDPHLQSIFARLVTGIAMIFVLLVVYPSLLIYFLTRPQVKEAFRIANWDATVEAEEA